MNKMILLLTLTAFKMHYFIWVLSVDKRRGLLGKAHLTLRLKSFSPMLKFKKLCLDKIN